MAVGVTCEVFEELIGSWRVLEARGTWDGLCELEVWQRRGEKCGVGVCSKQVGRVEGGVGLTLGGVKEGSKKKRGC